MCGVISTEFPQLTAGNFESSLASDDVLAHFFNDFLSLPSFPEDLLYNQQTGLFEVVSDAAEFVSRRIRSVLCTSRSQLLTGDPPQLARAPPLDNHYAVCCLDREQGSQWVKRERLPFFLQSDCYYEYRLAELLLQWGPHFCVHRRKSSLCRSTPSGPGLEVRTCSRSQENSSAQQGFSSSHLQCEEAVDLQSSQEQRDAASSRRVSPAVEQQLDYLVVQQVLRDAVNVMDGRSQSDSSGCFSQSGDGTDRKSADTSCECKVWSSAEDGEGSEGKKEKVQDAKRESEWEGKTDCDEKNREEGSRGTHHKNGLNICCHGTCCHGIRSGLDEFKEFLRGTQGEKLLNFWMDIERLKATQRKSRCLALMRSSYLWSSSHRRLNLELLSTLGLTTSPCWTDQKLRSVQPYITESLLYYWAPRFWTSRRVQADRSDSPPERCCSSAGMQPGHGAITLPLLRPDTCSPSYTVHTQLLSSRGQSLYSRRTERMLQALCVDLRAGLYFTHFCEQSGNQLWVNAVYFWADLQQYHELFHQDGPDPYRVQREAQVSTNTDSCTPPPLTPELLYSTYLFSCGGRSIGVNEEMRREVYDKLMPAVEELFDGVKEHTLSLLLEAWTLLVNRDHESFQQVCVQQEVRSINSEEFRELQSLYEESEQQLPQVLFPSSVTPPFSKGPHASDSWSTVPPNYHGYRLGSLLRHRHEIGHFMCFLQRREASVHLSCWLDLEQYRRTPQKDEAVRRERSAHIAAKYLNRKYFFGPDSPATTEQQNDILHLAGGLERLKSECLSNAVAVEMEDITRRHIEKTWLPEFLSTAEFTERHKHQPEVRSYRYTRSTNK
ncbi:regulator of G-protein signaling 22-like [Embiotoca jacksoni]|uniref:regulator of G-protein signaling 22-like n=1 Tax=Embiotoca jacksoni TaxID=100190 RepID=UPI003703BD5F